jgi:uncharacterized membrane protein
MNSDTNRRRLVEGIALLSAGLLAGAFSYGAVNVVAAFNNVPVDVRLTFHAALMQMNGIVVQTTMGVAALSTLALVVLSLGRRRLVAAAATLLVVASFLITRLGNVPINGQIKIWAVSTPPAGYMDLLDRWENYNIARTVTGVAAFLLVIAVVSARRADRA